jgi:hypothetical protein
MSEMSLVEAVRSLLDNGTTPSLGEGYIPTQEDVMRTRLALEEYDGRRGTLALLSKALVEWVDYE